jgi:hypothetical protein
MDKAIYLEHELRQVDEWANVGEELFESIFGYYVFYWSNLLSIGIPHSLVSKLFNSNIKASGTAHARPCMSGKEQNALTCPTLYAGSIFIPPVLPQQAPTTGTSIYHTLRCLGYSMKQVFGFPEIAYTDARSATLT